MTWGEEGHSPPGMEKTMQEFEELWRAHLSESVIVVQQEASHSGGKEAQRHVKPGQ